jgi:hypothetical protein
LAEERLKKNSWPTALTKEFEWKRFFEKIFNQFLEER